MHKAPTVPKKVIGIHGFINNVLSGGYEKRKSRGLNCRACRMRVKNAHVRTWCGKKYGPALPGIKKNAGICETRTGLWA
jgi:hypothetical protein